MSLIFIILVTGYRGLGIGQFLRKKSGEMKGMRETREKFLLMT
jgi:hypothetical protein